MNIFNVHFQRAKYVESIALGNDKNRQNFWIPEALFLVWKHVQIKELYK